MTTIVLFGILALIIVLIFAIIYFDLNGHFSFTDKVIKETEYTKTKYNTLYGAMGSRTVTVYVIERRYRSGRIKLITKEVNS